MEFYNPMQKKTAAPALKPSAVPGANPLNGDQRFTNKGGHIGYINMDQLGTGQWGTGESFQGAGRQGTIYALKNAMTTANPEDYAGMDELRNYYRSYLADLPGQTADKVSSFDTQSQRGLSNLLSQHRNAQAGTGRIGSRQFAGEQGNIYSKAASDYTTGLINARSSAIDQANKVGAGLSNVQNQDMQERQFQMDQGQRLSDMIYRLMALDRGQADVGYARAEKERERTGQMIQSGATLAALAAMSDARVKDRVREPSAREILKPFRRSQPKAYHYKNPEKHGEGESISPMAQELLESEFSDAVGKLPDGTLYINYGRVMGRMFSAISTLTKEVDHLRGELRALRKGGK